MTTNYVFYDKSDAVAKNYTEEEWRKATAHDSIVAFKERISDRALSSPLWHENYALATVQAMDEEYRQYVIVKYGP